MLNLSKIKGIFTEWVNRHFKNKIISMFILNLSTVSFYFLFTFLIMFFTFVILARKLGAAEFGEVNLINNISTYLLIFISFQFYNAMYKYLPDLEEEKFADYAFTAFTGNLLSIVLVAALSLMTYPLIVHKLHISMFSWKIAIIYTISTNIFLLFESFLRGKKLYKFISVSKFYTELFLFVLIVFSIFILGIRKFWIYPACYSLSRTIFIACSLVKQTFVVAKIQKKVFMEILSYSSLILINTLLSTVIFNSDIIILNYFHPGQVVGIYSAYQVTIKRFFITLFFNVFAVVFIPSIAAKDKKKILNTIGKKLPIVFLGISFCSFVITAIQIVMFGKQYSFNVIYTVISACSVSLHIVFQLYNTVLNLDGPNGLKLGLITLAIAIPLSLITQIYFTQHWVIIGALLASLFTNLLLVVIFKFLIRIRYKEKNSLKQNLIKLQEGYSIDDHNQP